MKSILVIEDSPDVLELVSQTLARRGYHTFRACNGEDGVKVALAQLPDLVICDVVMPKLNGFGVLAALRKNASTATVPFIFLTGESDKMNIRRGMELGADDYLAKPFTMSELEAAVRSRLDKQQILSEASERKLDQLRGSITLALPHELMTPLTGILGFSSFLVTDYARLQPDDIKEYGQIINNSALRLKRVVENFLLYAQLELAGASPAKLKSLREAEPIQTKDRIEAVAREKAAAAQRDKDLRLDVKEAMVAIPVAHFEKLVSEIVDNAFKFSDAGTEVLVASGSNGKSAVLKVVDRGRGMRPEQIASIGAHMQFERAIYEQQGAGLGFIIAKRLIEVYGGRLTVQSIPGLRTAVQVELPHLSQATVDPDAGI